jgi:hypothetical protein
MIYLAQFRFGTRLEETTGEFSFMAEAASQEEAELKLVRLLEGAVKNEEWFPAPCRILLALLAVMDRIPETGLAFHQRKRKLGEFEPDYFPMAYLPPGSVKILFDWEKDFNWTHDIPVPLIFVDRNRTLTFPIENVPPSLW